MFGDDIEALTACTTIGAAVLKLSDKRALTLNESVEPWYEVLRTYLLEPISDALWHSSATMVKKS